MIGIRNGMSVVHEKQAKSILDGTNEQTPLTIDVMELECNNGLCEGWGGCNIKQKNSQAKEMFIIFEKTFLDLQENLEAAGQGMMGIQEGDEKLEGKAEDDSRKEEKGEEDQDVVGCEIREDDDDDLMEMEENENMNDCKVNIREENQAKRGEEARSVNISSGKENVRGEQARYKRWEQVHKPLGSRSRSEIEGNVSNDHDHVYQKNTKIDNTRDGRAYWLFGEVKDKSKDLLSNMCPCDLNMNNEYFNHAEKLYYATKCDWEIKEIERHLGMNPRTWPVKYSAFTKTQLYQRMNLLREVRGRIMEVENPMEYKWNKLRYFIPMIGTENRKNSK